MWESGERLRDYCLNNTAQLNFDLLRYFIVSFSKRKTYSLTETFDGISGQVESRG